MTRETEQVFKLYEKRFGMVHPPLDYGHVHNELHELVALTREALRKGCPIPWDAQDLAKKAQRGQLLLSGTKVPKRRCS